MPVIIGKRFRFDAAHRLPRHDGKCSQPHGHTYTLEVDIEGDITYAKCSSQGMILDYRNMKLLVEQKVIDYLDHRDLNQVIPSLFRCPDANTDNVTTAERLVEMIGRLLYTQFHDEFGVRVTRVRIQETPDTWADWKP